MEIQAEYLKELIEKHENLEIEITDYRVEYKEMDTLDNIKHIAETNNND